MVDSENTQICAHRKARFDYFIEETIEAGLVLMGWEVKSLRAGKINLTDAHVFIKRGEAWLLNAQIQPLPTASQHTLPEPQRMRKLLLSRRQINHLIGCIERQGYTVIPLSLYWKNNKVKVSIAVAKGKKSFDKRESTKDRDWQRDKARIMKHRSE
ncbi:MAG: SsrA-binding protein SmpB [Legionellaceae bacterium]|nr:SsrA-binding protein SmpB [Legionellaceae bacterium]